jgi:hypothetical protein
MKTLAEQFDEKAVRIGGDLLRAEQALLPVLIEMRRLRLFAPLNYLGVWDYCNSRLHLSPAQSQHYKSVVEKSDEVPELKDAVLQGELTLSQARRIVPAVTQTNCREWIDKAKTLTQGKLEKEVKAVNPKAHIRERIRPIAKDQSELRVSTNSETDENIEVLHHVLSTKLKKAASLGEVVAWMAKEMREKHDPLRKAERARKVSSGNPKPGRRAVRKSIEHVVIKRDGNQCTYTSKDGRRCEQKRWLHKHHTIEVAKGGLNIPEHLRLLCHGHHRLTHQAPGP